MKTEEEIKLKILGENETRRVLNLIIPKIQKRLKDYTGIKILKVNQSFIKELSEEINNLLKSEREQIKITPFKNGDYAEISSLYLTSSPYDIILKMSICFNGGEYEDKTYYCSYYEKNFYVCSIENTQIKKFYDFEMLKTINAEKQIKQINRCLSILKQLREEKSRLTPYELESYIK